MSLGHGASIVRSGLVLHLDAANTKSYPGSGTAWNDLSGNGYNATLVSGATIANGSVSLQYSTAVNESGNDYVSAPSSLNTINAPLTMSCWFNIKSDGYSAAYKSLSLMGSSGTSATGAGIMIGVSNFREAWCLVYNGAGQQVQLRPTSPIMDLDKWYMMSVTHDGSVCKLYLNGIKIGETNVSGFTPFGTGSTFNIGLNRIYFHFGGSISSCMHYNTALNDAQIRQNFEALRGRYGI